MRPTSTHAAPAPARPPGPRGLPLLGNLVEYRKGPTAFFTRLAGEYGDIVSFRLGPHRAILLSDPELIRAVLITDSERFVKGLGLEVAKRILGQGLLTSEGKLHRLQRKLMQPFFHHQFITRYALIMARSAEKAAGSWRDGELLDIQGEMAAITLDIVTQSLFGANVSDRDLLQVKQALAAMLDIFQRMVGSPFLLNERIPTPTNLRLRRAKASLDEIVLRIIEDRRRAEGTEDLLSLLLQAEAEEGGGGRMTSAQLRDEAMTLFLAGHETTATALTWTWHLLAQHPEVEARLHEEVDCALQGRLPSAQDYSSLHYIKMVMAEAMRLYPPVYAFSRYTTGHYQLGPYRLPPKTLIIISPYVLHRDTRFFPEPTRFDPKRWTPETSAQRQKFSYLPFGAGSRSCIGEAFAWMEGVITLATIANIWRLQTVPGPHVEPHARFLLRPKHGLTLRAERRS